MEDLDVPVPVWLAVAAVLEREPDGLSVGGVARAVEAATAGQWSRRQTIGDALARMRRAGLLDMRRRRRGRCLPEKVHTLTPRGAELLAGARELVKRVLFNDDGGTRGNEAG